LKTEIKFQIETLDDEMRLQNILRADDLCFALKEILTLVDTYRLSAELRVEVGKVIDKLDLRHVVQ